MNNKDKETEIMELIAKGKRAEATELYLQSDCPDNGTEPEDEQEPEL